MKKVLSLLLVVGMLCSMIISVNAINKDGNFAFASDVTEVTVGDTFVVKVMLIGDTDPGVGLNNANVKVSATANASFDSAENGAASANYAGTNNFNKSTGVLQVMDASADVWAYGNGEYAILTFTALEAGTFTITNTSMNAKFAKAGTTEKFTLRTTIAPLSITIKAAEPVIEYEEKGDALTADKSVEAADGTKWNDLAIYKASFDLNKVVAEKGYGFDVNGTKNAITINGTGTVDYVLAFFGVAADKVPAVSTYYTVVK